MWMTRVSINHPVFATMVMVTLMVLGIFSYQRLGVEQMPDVSFPVVSVSVAYPGASPEQVENDITKPVELALNTINGVKMIRSNSWEGFSSTYVEFQLNADVTRAVQDVRDRVAQIRGSFPRDAKEPTVERGDRENDSPVVSYALMSSTKTQRELSRIAELDVQKAIERAQGVGRVVLNGTVSRQVQIRLRPNDLNGYGLSVEQVTAAIRSSNMSVPVGLVSNTNSETIVRVEGRPKSPEEFGRLIVARKGGAPVYLSQVADVMDTERERQNVSRMNGAQAIGVYVYKVQGSNLVETGNAVKRSVEALQKRLPKDVELKLLNANSDWVSESLTGVKKTILEGGLLTILIVFFFLASWRSTIITGLTLPIAVIATFTALYVMGFTLNFMTLMALSLCIGLLVDDAIVVRENIVRHLHMGKDHKTAARDGTEEIGLAVLATTLSIVAVFIPIAFMSGIVGKFFYAFGITVAVAVMVSLFVSFTLDPMLSAVWHDPPEGARNIPVLGRALNWFDRVMDKLHKIYDVLLRKALHWRKVTLGIAFSSLLASFALVPFVGAEFVPEVDNGWTGLRLTLPVGSSLEYAEQKVRRVEEVLKEFKEIDVVDTRIGGDAGKSAANISIKLVDRKLRKRSQKEIENAIREKVEPIPGIGLKVGWGNQIYVAILGSDDAAMERVVEDLKQKVGAVKGVVDVETSVKEGTPALNVRLNPELANEFGLTASSVGSILRTYVNGDVVSYWQAPDGQNYEVNVQLPKSGRTNVQDVANLNVVTGRLTADGQPMVVPLRQVATITPTFNPEVIKRQDLQRRVALYAGVRDRPFGDVDKEVKTVIDNYQLPPGLRFDVGGQSKDMQEAFTAMLASLALAVVFIYIVLASQFGSFLQPVAIMASLPLSLVGVMLALLLTGTTLNIFSMIGLVFLMGLVTKNAILLVDFANQGQREGMSQYEALLAAGQIRLRPILMTTAAMVFGMLPLALGLGEGSEQQAPMGRAIIGGVITSTLLTLVVVPVIYTWLDRKGARARKQAAQAAQNDAKPTPQADDGALVGGK